VLISDLIALIGVDSVAVQVGVTAAFAAVSAPPLGALFGGEETRDPHPHLRSRGVLLSCQLICCTLLFCCAGGSDRSIRRWERTSEPFFVEEEKERRLESLFEADLEQQQQRQQGSLILGPQGGTYAAAAAAAAGGDDAAAAAAGRRTAESVSAADTIMDALDVAGHETEKQQEYKAAAAAAQVCVFWGGWVGLCVWVG
jgi:hypothetical protein